MMLIMWDVKENVELYCREYRVTFINILVHMAGFVEVLLDFEQSLSKNDKKKVHRNKTFKNLWQIFSRVKSDKVSHKS